MKYILYVLCIIYYLYKHISGKSHVCVIHTYNVHVYHMCMEFARLNTHELFPSSVSASSLYRYLL